MSWRLVQRPLLAMLIGSSHGLFEKLNARDTLHPKRPFLQDLSTTFLMHTAPSTPQPHPVPPLSPHAQFVVQLLSS